MREEAASGHDCRREFALHWRSKASLFLLLLAVIDKVEEGLLLANILLERLLSLLNEGRLATLTSGLPSCVVAESAIVIFIVRQVASR